jgi:hypothetical protein
LRDFAATTDFTKTVTLLPASAHSRGQHMQGRPRLQAVNHRDVAAQFRSLAAIEPLPSLRDRLQRIAERHDELAAGFDADEPHDEPGAPLR